MTPLIEATRLGTTTHRPSDIAGVTTRTSWSDPVLDRANQLGQRVASSGWSPMQHSSCTVWQASQEAFLEAAGCGGAIVGCGT